MPGKCKNWKGLRAGGGRKAFEYKEGFTDVSVPQLSWSGRHGVGEVDCTVQLFGTIIQGLTHREI